jgi:hypothetical protein
MATTKIPNTKFRRRYTLRFIALVRSLRFVVSFLLLSPTVVVVRVDEGLFRREDADDNIERQTPTGDPFFFQSSSRE